MVETVNFLTRTLLSSRLITRYGLRVGLLVHPIGLMGFSVLLAVIGTTAGMRPLFFWLTALTKLCDEVLWKAIEEPVFLILYQPLPAQQRFTVQIAMQGIMGPLAVALCGAILLFGNMAAHLGQLALVTLAVLAGTVVVSLKVQREYAGALKQALTKRTLEGMALSLHDPSSIAVLQRELQSPYPGEVIYALELLEKLEHPPCQPCSCRYSTMPMSTYARMCCVVSKGCERRRPLRQCDSILAPRPLRKPVRQPCERYVPWEKLRWSKKSCHT